MKNIKNIVCAITIMMMFHTHSTMAIIPSTTTILAYTGKGIFQHITLPLFTIVKNVGVKGTQFIAIKGGTYTIKSIYREMTTSNSPISGSLLRTLAIIPLTVGSAATMTVTTIGSWGVSCSLVGINFCDDQIKADKKH